MVNVGENNKKIGEKYAKKISSDMSQQNKKESDSETEEKDCNQNVASKVEFNPQIHSLENTDEKKNKRFRKRDKVKKIKRKRLEKEQLYNENYNDLLLDNLEKATHTTKSPHLVIGNKWFKKIHKNVIMLKSPKEVEIDSNRRIQYEIDCFGSDIRKTWKENYWILNVSNTPTNTIFILVRLKDIFHIPKVQYHTVLGKRIYKYDVDKDRDYCYVLLAMIHEDKKIRTSPSIIESNDLHLMKYYLRNQIATTTKNYHFNTTGIIYGFGYGPKSNRNEYGHSVCRFANSKSNFLIFFYLNLILMLIDFNLFPILDINKKKITDNDKKRLEIIEEDILRFMESRIVLFNKILPPLHYSISPWINKLHVHVDAFPERETKDRKFADSGFITYNLCLNAQTEVKHTECDASYTIIAVPKQLTKEKWEKKKILLNLNLISTMTA